MQDHRGKQPHKKRPPEQRQGGEQGGAMNRRENDRAPRSDDRERDIGGEERSRRPGREDEEDEIDAAGRRDRDTSYWPRRHDQEPPLNEREPYASD